MARSGPGSVRIYCERSRDGHNFGVKRGAEASLGELLAVLGIAGVIVSFGLFYMGERLFHLNRDLIQTLIYLKLSVAGHLTIFVTRTRGPFWSTRPAPLLLRNNMFHQ